MKRCIDHAETTCKMQVLPADVIFKVQNEIRILLAVCACLKPLQCTGASPVFITS